MSESAVARIEAGVLDLAYVEHGSRDGAPVILLHGFPYDVHAYEAVAPELAAAGHRVIVPYLRGFGPTPTATATRSRRGTRHSRRRRPRWRRRRRLACRRWCSTADRTA